MDTRLEEAPVRVSIDGEAVADATLRVEILPDKALISFALVGVPHGTRYPDPGEMLSFAFKDPRDAVAFMAAADPSCVKKDM